MFPESQTTGRRILSMRFSESSFVVVLAILMSIFTRGTASGSPRSGSCNRAVIFRPGDSMTFTNIVKEEHRQSCEWIIINNNNAEFTLTCHISRHYYDPEFAHLPALPVMRHPCRGGLVVQPLNSEMENIGQRREICDKGKSTYGPANHRVKITFQHDSSSDPVARVTCRLRSHVRR